MEPRRRDKGSDRLSPTGSAVGRALVIEPVLRRFELRLLQELGYAIAIHPSNPLARAVLGMLEGLCELNGGNLADHLPSKPAEFFNLVGMAEWLDLDAKYARLEEVR